MLRCAAVTLLLALLAAAPLAAREEIPAETRKFRFDGVVPACDDQVTLERMRARFERTERRYWNNEIQILSFDHVRQVAYRPHGLDLIPRRYCEARALTMDRRRLTFRYAIIEDYGVIGASDDVQFCVVGYDRNFTAMPECRRLDR